LYIFVLDDENLRLILLFSSQHEQMNVDKMGNDLNKVSKAEVEADIDFNDMTLYEPGNKVTIPLTRPDYHLTQPCFR